ncbi:MAG: lipoate--protein ligase family protein [Chloroflexi bacterium]|nr:lipoate--protein ligase family protein [Chloroflexota bacterium]MBP8056813.1 lipoate--protein ligase family protein [Chloroflexota bacterium]
MGKRRQRPETFPSATWRLVQTGWQDGPTNLAWDEAIIEAVAAGDSPPTLRFYGFDPVCLTLGYEQEWDGADFTTCEAEGWQVTRRASDSRAILHAEDLNYALYMPLTDARAQGDAAASARRINLGLQYGLINLGLDPSRMQPFYHDTGEPGFSSIDGPSPYNIVAGQLTLLASAQWRQAHALLQHGSLPLTGDVTRVAKALYFDLPGQRMAVQLRLGRRAIALNMVLGHPKTFAETSEALAQGLGEVLDLTFISGEVTPAEQFRARQLRAKYASDTWIKKF